VLLLVIDGFRWFRFSADESAGNVFNGGTLEWLPNGLHSVRSIPVVTDREPIWADARLADDVEQGRYFLPNSAIGRRESLITSTMRAEPQYVQIMPGPSAWPLLAALFTAGFFLLLTVKAIAPAALCGALMIVSVVRWLWDTDRPVEQSRVDAGAGIMLPTHFTGPQSHGWWAMVILNVVLGMIFLMAVFSYLHLFGVHPEWWLTAAPMGAVGPGLALLALAGGLALASRPVLAHPGSGTGWSVLMMLTSVALLALALWIDFSDWWDAGLRGPASAQGATVYVLQSWQMVMVVTAAIMALYLLARFLRGLVTHPASTTLEVVRLFALYATGQGLVVLLLPRLLPGAGA
jgi:cytochrome c oxidase subunit I+III